MGLFHPGYLQGESLLATNTADKMEKPTFKQKWTAFVNSYGIVRLLNSLAGEERVGLKSVCFTSSTTAVLPHFSLLQFLCSTRQLMRIVQN